MILPHKKWRDYELLRSTSLDQLVHCPALTESDIFICNCFLKFHFKFYLNGFYLYCRIYKSIRWGKAWLGEIILFLTIKGKNIYRVSETKNNKYWHFNFSSFTPEMQLLKLHKKLQSLVLKALTFVPFLSAFNDKCSSPLACYLTSLSCTCWAWKPVVFSSFLQVGKLSNSQTTGNFNLI